uniref:ATP synthase peripheral stalk subunit F6, mitochondrial n=1 Tax=Astyanax mexicanus TaxID=7994 RepID=W5KN19_ASTMX
MIMNIVNKNIKMGFSHYYCANVSTGRDLWSSKMAASLLRIGRLGSLKALQVESWGALTRAPAVAFSSKSGDSKKSKKSNKAGLDPIQRLFLDSIRDYSTQSKSSGGLVDAGPEYQKALAEEIAKLQRLYGGGDLNSFPEFKFPEPKLDEVSSK